jgi:hypothetical protein
VLEFASSLTLSSIDRRLHFNVLKPSIVIASFMPGTALGDRSVYPAEFIENI